ncbi:hypothetical protein HN51_005341 [Arachis hypogaea]
MQQRENNVQSFEKFRQVRRNLEQAKSLVQAMIKREEKKREVMDNEVMLQRIQMKYKATYELTSDSLSQREIEFSEDSLALSRLAPYSSKFVSSEEEFFESDMMTSHPHSRPSVPLHVGFLEIREVWDDSIIETAEEIFDGSKIGDFINAIQENITKEWDFEVKGWETCNSNQITCPDMYVPGQCQGKVHRWPRMGGHRFIGMRTQHQKLTRKCEVTAILVLYDLPRLLTGAILAHRLLTVYSLQLELNDSVYKDLDSNPIGSGCD